MPKLPVDKPRERLAISLFDLDSVDPILRQKLFAGRVNLVKQAVIRIETDAAVELTCDLLAAAIVCDILRAENRREGDSVTKVYIHRGKAWTKLSSTIILTAMGSDKQPQLNYEIFTSELELAPPVPIVPRAMKFGKS